MKMIDRTIRVLIEILCFYQILRGINNFKATENFVYIFTNKQWIRWGSILCLFGYTVGISILWQSHADLALAINFIGTIILPVIIITAWRTSLRKIILTFLLFFLTTGPPIFIFGHWLSMPVVITNLITLVILSLLIEFKVVHKIYDFIMKNKVLLCISCFISSILLLIASLSASSLISQWYNRENALLIMGIGVFSLVAVTIIIAIYVTIKRVEMRIVRDLKGRSYLEFKAKLEKYSIRITETDHLDIFELQSFWFSKQLRAALLQEVDQLNLKVNIIEEKEQMKIHLLKKHI